MKFTEALLLSVSELRSFRVVSFIGVLTVGALMQSAPTSFVTRISDPGLLVSAIRGSSLGPFQLSATPAPSLMARLSLQRLCFDYASVGPAMLFTGQMASDCFTLTFVTECPVPGKAFNFSIGIEKGYLGFFPPGGVIDACTPAGFANVTLTIPTAQFLAALEIHFPEMPEDFLKNGGQLIVGAEEEARLRKLVGEVTDLLISNSLRQANMAVSRQMESELLEAYFAAVRSGCREGRLPRSWPASHRQRHLIKAREFIAAHGHRPVPLEELCGELGLSARSLQQIFQSQLSISPVTYLKHHRLQGVRRALQVARPELGAVKNVALDWGFWHLGRFAADYKALFGESPHKTLGSRHDLTA